jgi:hypothetical protein
MVFHAGCQSCEQVGCESDVLEKTDFLSDYSKLAFESDTSLQYVNQQALDSYSSFIVNPVVVHFHKCSKAVEETTKGKLTQQQIDNLTNYMRAKIEEAVRNAGKEVAYLPGPGVARIRIGITDIEGSSLANLMPTSKLTGMGVGGATMEAEVLDSESGEQVGAIIERSKGNPFLLSDLGKWDAAKSSIDEWAKRLQSRLG